MFGYGSRHAGFVVIRSSGLVVSHSYAFAAFCVSPTGRICRSVVAAVIFGRLRLRLRYVPPAIMDRRTTPLCCRHGTSFRWAAMAARHRVDIARPNGNGLEISTETYYKLPRHD